MLSKVLLLSLFAAVVVAAPALSIRDPRPKPDVPCTTGSCRGADLPLARAHEMRLGVISPGPQGPGSPPVINLNPAAPSPSVINLNPAAPTQPVINLNPA